MRIVSKFARFTLIIGCLLQIQCTGKTHPKFTGDLEPFYGTYKGNTLNIIKGEMSERELAVTIKPWEDKGFTIEWTTIIYRASGEESIIAPSINFFSSPRPGIYGSSMRADIFGNSAPFNPIGKTADPYVWAGLENKTLTVSALYILDSGGYELHVYKRTLQGNGLVLEFERINNGEKKTETSAILERVES